MCPMCNGPATVLGSLGRLTYLRCRNCGWDFSQDHSPEEDASDGASLQAHSAEAESLLRFTDGVQVDTSGEYRILKLHDGWYVVGRGRLRPCADEDEAIQARDEWVADSSTIRGFSRSS